MKKQLPTKAGEVFQFSTNTEVSAHTQLSCASEIIDLSSVNPTPTAVLERLAKLEKNFENIKNRLNTKSIEKVILIREIPYSRAKKEIEGFIRTNKTTDLEKIQDNLRLNLELIVKIVRQLHKEKKIRYR